MAIQAATTAPSLCPQSAARSMPIASITPRHSRAYIRWYPSGTAGRAGEAPYPTRSGASRWKAPESASTCRSNG